jgi:hypothetical protein
VTAESLGRSFFLPPSSSFVSGGFGSFFMQKRRVSFNKNRRGFFVWGQTPAVAG